MASSRISSMISSNPIEGTITIHSSGSLPRKTPAVNTDGLNPPCRTTTAGYYDPCFCLNADTGTNEFHLNLRWIPPIGVLPPIPCLHLVLGPAHGLVLTMKLLNHTELGVAITSGEWSSRHSVTGSIIFSRASKYALLQGV